MFTRKERIQIEGHQNVVWKVINDIKQSYNIKHIEERELFQEGICVLMNDLRKYQKDKGNFINFIYPRIKVRLVRFIKKQQNVVYLDDLPEKEDKHLSIEEKYETIDTISNATKILNPKEQDYFRAYYQEDKQIKELAKEFHISSQAVSKTIKNINRKIKGII